MRKQFPKCSRAASQVNPQAERGGAEKHESPTRLSGQQRVEMNTRLTSGPRRSWPSWSNATMSVISSWSFPAKVQRTCIFLRGNGYKKAGLLDPWRGTKRNKYSATFPGSLVRLQPGNSSSVTSPAQSGSRRSNWSGPFARKGTKLLKLILHFGTLI